MKDIEEAINPIMQKMYSQSMPTKPEPMETKEEGPTIEEVD